MTTEQQKHEQHQYGSRNYWNDRYAKWPDHFDWYNAWLSLKPILKQAGVSPVTHNELLHVGVGSSRLQNDLHREGYCVTNIDFSSVAIENLLSSWKGQPTAMKYVVADVRNMQEEFQDDSFDLVLDKGTLDAMLCGSDSGLNSAMMIAECHRVLREDGVLIIISYGDPKSRLPLLLEPSVWEWKSVDVYCQIKGEENDVGSKGWEDEVDATTISSYPSSLKIEGPYSSSDTDEMMRLSEIERCHYVYVCVKAASDGMEEHEGTTEAASDEAMASGNES